MLQSVQPFLCTLNCRFSFFPYFSGVAKSLLCNAADFVQELSDFSLQMSAAILNPV
jgi:hypothetical protein